MFEDARIKLTAWYLVIIMTISGLFSFVIYHNINNEFRRFEKLSELMQKERVVFDGPFRRLQLPPSRIDLATIREARRRLVTALGLINIAILGIAGTAGYFLAGRTLRPIRSMVDEQNQFISDASHELRTPLTALKAELEVTLRDKRLTLPQAKHTIKDSIAEVNTLQALSDSLLTLAQYQKPNGHTPMQYVSLEEAARAAIKNVQPLATAKRISLIPRFQSVRVRGNPYSLTELAVILLDNAIKYSNRSDEIEIIVKKQGAAAILAVSDHGVGIPEKDLPHIFDRFYRADAARTKSAQNGYGLGLAIAKKISDLHHATISVTSKPNVGSTFTVTFDSARFQKG